MTTTIDALIALLPPGTLPPGRLVAADEGEGEARYWLSDGPAPDGLWQLLQAQHPATGLWPLLLGGLSTADDSRPWADGEVFPACMSAPGDHDARATLAEWWPQDDLPELSPYGNFWPGLADPGELVNDPAVEAAAFAQRQEGHGLRLGLAAAGRGADALTVTGWSGPVNYTNDTAEISAVVRSWEDRFGARVVSVGFDTLQLSVAAPPRTDDHALHVAAEHYAFCPDLVHQGAGTLFAYAKEIQGARSWSFWWD